MKVTDVSYENLTMYPDFATIAKEEGHSEAARLFKNIGQVEVEHEKMYKKLLARLSKGMSLQVMMKRYGYVSVWICTLW